MMEENEDLKVTEVVSDDLKVRITCPVCGHTQEYEVIFEKEDD